MSGSARESETPVAVVRRALDRIAAAEREENHVLEEVVENAADEFRALPPAERVPALMRAVGSSQARRTRAVLLLCSVPQDPRAREVMREWITDPAPEVRSYVIQTIGAAGLDEFAPLLAERIANDDELFCRDMAVHAAGRLRSAACLPVILELADTDFSRWRLAEVLARYATDEVEPYLRAWFDDSSVDHEVRLQAAWGLGKRGERRAVDYLAECLLAGQGRNRFRCAQALCDINGWPWEWHIDAVERTAARVRSQRSR